MKVRAFHFFPLHWLVSILVLAKHFFFLHNCSFLLLIMTIVYVPPKVQGNGAIKWRERPFTNQQQCTFLIRKHNLMTKNWSLWSFYNAAPKYTPVSPLLSYFQMNVQKENDALRNQDANMQRDNDYFNNWHPCIMHCSQTKPLKLECKKPDNPFWDC